MHTSDSVPRATALAQESLAPEVPSRSVPASAAAGMDLLRQLRGSSFDLVFKLPKDLVERNLLLCALIHHCWCFVEANEPMPLKQPWAVQLAQLMHVSAHLHGLLRCAVQEKFEAAATSTGPDEAQAQPSPAPQLATSSVPDGPLLFGHRPPTDCFVCSICAIVNHRRNRSLSVQ